MLARTLAVAVAVLTLPVAAEAARTLRVDYYHTGNAKQEMFSVDRVVDRAAGMARAPQKAIDRTNLGKYFFEVQDPGSGRVLYSRGFASIYGEWETTDEATTMNAHVSRVVSLPRAGRGRARRPAQARCEESVPRHLDDDDRSQEHVRRSLVTAVARRG